MDGSHEGTPAREYRARAEARLTQAMHTAREARYRPIRAGPVEVEIRVWEIVGR